MTRAKAHPSLAPEQVATILESIADGVFTVDRDFVITSFNRAAEKITGFRGAEAGGERTSRAETTTVNSVADRAEMRADDANRASRAVRPRPAQTAGRGTRLW